MNRIIMLVVALLIVVAAAVLYAQKHDATLARDRIATLRDEIAGLEAEVDVLRAEWTALNDPGRIQALADRFLALGPVQPDQFVHLRDLPMRPAADLHLAGEDQELITGSIPGSPSDTGEPVQRAGTGIDDLLDGLLGDQGEMR